ncbi:3-hydroxyacyl-CoA dehydrogenase/enoyl-CoA hydratase family protein [Altibacter sp. HG106]|uniref:3-hydroxyacyl-CoA dehydrogenase/enoyl-CoA hydratase family protein n=1 Tax=Altibacter sp. HG106 TaxID=3023937 RepID=UPI00235039C4|nr:3-hydroxyacyl-CoA dehydrogenase/enoyl-CoA hydratase family protein [Altibacter sp. HG106]MDC7993791.1 3-hydroxyacyl-CoA dehydrogenase NAD-binding domain-containing protein [Altibacter sp. HG106]
MSKRRIEKVAVIGSGIMGSGIACHFANIGAEVLLLDIVPRELTEKEKAKGLSLEDTVVRNRIVNDSLQSAIKSKPAPLYHKDFASRISTGNLEDDIAKVSEADWIIEVVVERLDIKKQVFENLEKHRTPGTLITSNTSGIPIQYMNEGRSEDFRKHFCGTHFFNPPRYLDLFEIIPGPDTDPEVLAFLNGYGEKFLGKTSVVAKDTPAFIGNRIGIFGIQSLFHQVKEMGLTVEEVDKLTGPVIGRPKSATFRTVDVVGLDTLVHVANGIYENVPEDEEHEIFQLPEFINTMMENKWLGSKSGQGFYKKIKNDDGSSKILALDLDTMEYRDSKKANFDTLQKTKSVDEVLDRFPILIQGEDKAGEFYRKNFGAMFAYVSKRIPEITDELYKIDDAMKAGFGWQNGPFEIWDAVGVEKGIELIEALDKEPAAWVQEMLDNGITSFYTVKDGATYYYDIPSKEYKKIPGQDAFIILDNIRESKAVFQNSGVVVEDLGDGILNCEFRSKMNSIGGDVLAGVNKAIDLAEKEYDGLVIGNQGKNFSVGANVGMIFMMAVEQEYDELNMAVKYFQDTCMRLRYSSIPTVVAPHGMSLGGGCEMTLHADRVVAAAESYIGLVEFGVGVIPGGGGSKEMALRASDTFQKNDVELNRLREYFLAIGMAKVSTSAYEAYDTGILQKGKDIVVVNKDRQIATAKAVARMMADQGYTKPVKRQDVKVLGKQALGMFLVGTDSMEAGHYISEHDKKIANKLAWVMAGGDLSEPTEVSEQYLLDLEREAFLSLCGERKTLERLQHMIQKNKPLRN